VVDPVLSFLAALRRTARRERLAIQVREETSLHRPLCRDGRFDLALATFDVLNHLRTHAKLPGALSGIARALEPGGHFLFDLNMPELLFSVSEHHRIWRLSSGAVSAETGEWDARVRRGSANRARITVSSRRR
jgi:SAM-dependent methyltransferase